MRNTRREMKIMLVIIIALLINAIKVDETMECDACLDIGRGIEYGMIRNYTKAYIMEHFGRICYMGYEYNVGCMKVINKLIGEVYEKMKMMRIRNICERDLCHIGKK